MNKLTITVRRIYKTHRGRDITVIVNNNDKYIYIYIDRSMLHDVVISVDDAPGARKKM